MIVKLMIFLGALVLLGCESTAVFEADPNQKIMHGFIQTKSLEESLKAKQEALNAENDPLLANSVNAVLNSGASSFSEGMISGVLFAILHEEFGDAPTLPGATFIYMVKAENGRYFKVRNKYPEFKPGDCVKLFVSEQPEKFPTRMADGYDCRGGR